MWAIQVYCSFIGLVNFMLQSQQSLQLTNTSAIIQYINLKFLRNKCYIDFKTIREIHLNVKTIYNHASVVGTY